MRTRQVGRSGAAGRRRGDRGSMAVEVVLLTPLLVAFMLLVVAFGQFVSVRAEVESASREAVRAASFERDRGTAQAVATNIANEQLDTRADCGNATLGGTFEAGEIITVELNCVVDLSSLGLIGLPGTVNISAESAAPLDLFRRAG